MAQRIIAILLIIAAVGLAAFTFLQQQAANERAEQAMTAQANAESARSVAQSAADAASTNIARAQTAQAQDQAARATAVDEAREAATAQAQAQVTQIAAESGRATAQSRAEAALSTSAAVASAAADLQTEAEATRTRAESLLAEAHVTITAEALARATTQVEQDNLATAQAVRETAMAANPPTATPGALTAIYASADGVVTFQYPANWVVDDSTGSIYFSNLQSGLASSDQPIGRGTLRGYLFLQAAQPPATTTAADIVNATADTLAGSSTAAGGTIRFEPASDITISGQPAALAIGGSQGLEFILIGVPLQDNLFGVFAGISSVGDMPQYEPTLLSIAASVRGGQSAAGLSSAHGPLTARFTSGDGLVLFNYPDNWVIEEREGQIFFGSSQRALDSIGSPINRGDIRGYFTIAFKEEGSLLEVLDGAADALFGDPIPGDVPAAAVNLGGREGASVRREGASISLFVVGIDLGEVYGLMVGLGTLDVMPQGESILLSMAATLQLGQGQASLPATPVVAAATPIPTTPTPAIDPPTEQKVTFTTISGKLSLSHSYNWFAAEVRGQVIVANAQQLVASTSTPPSSGEFVASLFHGETESITSLSENATPREIVELVVTPRDDTESPFGEVTELQIGDFPAARSQGQLGGSDVLVIAIIPQPGYSVVAVGYSVAGELAYFEETLLDILSSVTINE